MDRSIGYVILGVLQTLLGSLMLMGEGGLPALIFTGVGGMALFCGLRAIWRARLHHHHY
ncbi:hypothetical protein [Algivirga pacifica]|uniref:hypothetical protein n=1 Tax=Algivirga pacifica TaxID=1162670 RepID=UPI0031EA73DB